jgi:hypothetical protein
VEKNNMIKINIEKAKNIAHDIRRKAREQEFAPLDSSIMKQIPGIDLKIVEQERQQIRNKYGIIQEEIDAAYTIDQIKQALQQK